MTDNFLKEFQQGMEPQAKRMRKSIRAEMRVWEKALEKKYGIIVNPQKKKKDEPNRQKA